MHPAFLHNEDVPGIAAAEQCSDRHDDRLVGFVNYDLDLDTVTVPQGGPRLARRGYVDDDPDSLFFNPERGDFGEAGRLDASHRPLQICRAAPSLDDHLVAILYAGGVSRQNIDCDFEIAWITQLDQRGSLRDNVFAFLDDPENPTIYG